MACDQDNMNNKQRHKVEVKFVFKLGLSNEWVKFN